MKKIGVFNPPRKNERKQFDLLYHSSKIEFCRSFFGRIEDTKRHLDSGRCSFSLAPTEFVND